MDRIILTEQTKESLVNEITESVLAGMVQLLEKREQTIEDKENWTISETADYLKVSKVTIHSYVRQGLLKKHKLGSKTLFKKSEVMASIKTQKNVAL